MRDTSEYTDATEQAKEKDTNPTPKPRSTARSRTENTAPGSTSQETKPATRRRTTSSTHTTATHAQTGSEQTSENSASTTTTAPRQTTHRPSKANQQGETSTGQNVTGHSTQRPNNGGGQQTHSQTTSNGTVRNNADQRPESGNVGQRPSNAGQRPGNIGQRPSNVGQRPGNIGQRPGNVGQRPETGNVGQRSGSGYSGQRSGSGYAGQRPGYNSGGQRSGSGYSGQPRQGNYQQRSHTPNTNQTTPTGGNTATAPRPQRPGGSTHGANRPRPNQQRPGNRPSATHRTQERRAAQVKEKPTGPVSLPPQIVVKDLAELLQTTSTEVIKTLIKHGVFASINQVVEYEKASLAAKDLGFEPSPTEAAENGQANGDRKLSANEVMMASRNDGETVEIPPVVTIMGHVDHGKTSLLDVIRKTKVAAGEAGGITQHIGAYQVEINGKKITFLDTPGHEAFTAMRARGAQGAHIAIIVVAADDGVMPQTREAIDHAQAAKVPIIIALNKIDKANANPDHVKQQLAEIGLVVEEYGGDIICVPVSARKGEGIDSLLEYIVLVAEIQDIRANPNRSAVGVIVEAKLEKNTGPTATVLVQQGTLKMGDNFVVGEIVGKVRAMFNDRGKRIQKAPPSTPVSILGLPEVPQAGDRLEVYADERAAKLAAQQEVDKRRNETTPPGQVSLDTLYMQMQEGTVKELNLILKSDVQGSSEALKSSLSKLGEENLKVRLIREGIGNVSETDVHLASASGAIIIAFNVKVDGAAQREAQKEGVDIRYYEVIYKLIDDIEAALKGMLEPTYREVIDGHAEIIQSFKAGKSVVAGCRVTDGKFQRSSQVRILRKNEKVFDGQLASLRRGKDDVREVATGYECGMLFEDYNAFEVGDIVEAYSQEKVQPGA